MTETKSDEELMVLYQLGDEQAFAVLFKRHSPRIYAYLKSKLREDSFVQDVFQATFLKLHVTRSKYNTSLPFLPWLYTVCKNEMIDAIRKEQRKRGREIASDVLVEIAAPEEPIQEQTINLNELPATQKLILQMRYEDELSFSEIAKKLNTTGTNARQLVSRAVRVVRKIYGQ